MFGPSTVSLELKYVRLYGSQLALSFQVETGVPQMCRPIGRIEDATLSRTGRRSTLQ